MERAEREGLAPAPVFTRNPPWRLFAAGLMDEGVCCCRAVTAPPGSGGNAELLLEEVTDAKTSRTSQRTLLNQPGVHRGPDFRSLVGALAFMANEGAFHFHPFSCQRLLLYDTQCSFSRLPSSETTQHTFPSEKYQFLHLLCHHSERPHLSYSVIHRATVG